MKYKSNKKLPRFRRSLFWDVDPKRIDPKRHARYIIERILDFGTDAEIKWIWEHYPHSVIYDISKKSRSLSGPSRALWQLLVKK